MCEDERKGKKILVVASIVIIIILILSGSILWLYYNPNYPQYQHNIDYLSASVEIDYNETIMINYEQAKLDLEAIGYNVTIAVNQSQLEYGDDSYVTGLLAKISGNGSNTLSISVFGVINETKAVMNMFYSSPTNYTDPRDGQTYYPKANQESIDTTKEYMIYRADEIANVINLSLQWENLVWNVAYGS